MTPSGGSEVKKEENEVGEENHAEGETSCDDNVAGEQEDGDGGEAKVVEEAVARFNVVEKADKVAEDEVDGGGGRGNLGGGGGWQR